MANLRNAEFFLKTRVESCQETRLRRLLHTQTRTAIRPLEDRGSRQGNVIDQRAPMATPDFFTMLDDDTTYSYFFDDTAASDRRSRISRIASPHLAVVNNRAGGLVPDLDPESIYSVAARQTSIDHGQNEVVTGRAVNLPEPM